MPNGRNIDTPGSAGGRASSAASDIDALVVGAVYGELTPAEQAQLSAHLETHPNDQRALDDLRATRQVIRESRVVDHQVDPPQSVSALLMQEAARRAPTRDAELGWFARFVSGLVAHPALASVASLVLVVGVAGTIYLKTGDVSVAERPMGQSAAGRAVGARAAAPTEEAAAAEPTIATSSDKEGVRVGLDDSSNRGKGMTLSEGKMGVSHDPMTEPRDQPKAKAALAKDTRPEFARAKSDLGSALGQSPVADDVRRAKKSTQAVLADSSDAPSDRASVAQESVPSRDVSGGADSTASGGMRNTSPRAQKPSAPPAVIAADRELDRDEAPPGQFAAAPRPAAPAGKQQVPTAANAQRLPEPVTNQQRKAAPVANTQQQAAPVTNVQRPAAQTANAQRQVAPTAVQQQAAPFATAPQAAGPAGSARGYGGAAYGNDEGAYDRRDSAKQEAQSSTWARDTHRRVLALVKAGKCQDASPLVQQLRSRDPNYFAAKLAGDRSLGPCLARIAENAERDAKSRAKEAAKAGAAQ